MTSHTRTNTALTSRAETRLLQVLAAHAPAWLTSDQLTALGFLAQLAAGAFYALSRRQPLALLPVCACLVLNWLGDSLDGTLARHRQQPRPRFGFYVDHIVDCLGAIALLTGLGASGFLHWPVAAAMLVAFLLLAAESYLATFTLGRFELSQGIFGPTELRLLLIAGNLALLHNPFCTILHHRILLFDLGGTAGAAAMFVLALAVAARHTAQLYRLEPLPAPPAPTSDSSPANLRSLSSTRAQLPAAPTKTTLGPAR